MGTVVVVALFRLQQAQSILVPSKHHSSPPPPPPQLLRVSLICTSTVATKSCHIATNEPGAIMELYFQSHCPIRMHEHYANGAIDSKLVFARARREEGLARQTST